MTEFDYLPIRTLNIHELIQFSKKEFISTYIVPGSAVSWCDGVMYYFVPMPTTPDIVVLQLRGVYHWYAFGFCKYEKYEEKVINRDINHEQHVQNNTSHPLFRELVEWLKSKPVWYEKVEGNQENNNPRDDSLQSCVKEDIWKNTS